MNNKGFTLIELMVATALFSVVVAITSGVFIQSLRTQQLLVALMAANDNASLSLEQIAKEIYTGSQFFTSADKTELSFINQRAGPVVYKFNKDNNTIERNGVALTSSNVKIQYLFFDLMGSELNDGQSTRVTVRLGVSVNDKRAEGIITNLQTTVSSRQLDT